MDSNEVRGFNSLQAQHFSMLLIQIQIHLKAFAANQVLNLINTLLNISNVKVYLVEQRYCLLLVLHYFNNLSHDIAS